ncbi:tripartite tricarboxylate transporter substrate binding protein [Microbacterium sp. EYE_5]|uniref:tripartite tricarboxylate transporter substrate binding protein n=1 Tax=unclassified Microbacterium TaxID=2609290 RepID=UPI00200695B6|nr:MULTISPECIES: tripartite tricarboxylate transporter substrate-binding protein [unclassified Microbacterium]MCK6226471.1 tripartite tricarboxylate transporter substrate binding protein [Microbacterium sp. EYE_77]MCK6245555.1 tripartite tricarboxylate transporter substrate binding protein [Microbacterium sp. EYE_78]MCK6080364.1 tripartite tricarboxylate transporter substrate binding protein [Microbacterium sp. EYE_382]MCK6085635.1 tripartite tricarboxylate transporter substrate binding protein
MTPTDTPTTRATRATPRTVIGRVIGGAIAVAAIGTAAVGSISSAASGQEVGASMTIIAPAAAGGGWDGVARELQQAQKANGLVNNVQVVNMPGAGGTIALGNVSVLEGQPNNMLVGGTGLLAATIQFDSAATLDDVTPLAVVVEEYDVIVVPADSPYDSLDDLVAAWKEDPKSIPWTGGGSFDQLVVTDLALAAGIDPIDTTYISSDGGGEAIQALLNGTAQAAAGGYPDNIDQIEAGRLRALALVASQPIDGIDIPTAKDQGFDVSLTNWRSLSAPTGLDEDDREALTDLVLDSVATPQWADAMDRYHWTERIITGDDLDAFLQDEESRIRALYEEMGL